MLDSVASGGEHVPLTAIAAGACVPKPTAYRLLRELASAGWLHREASAPGGFTAGPRLERLALALVENGGCRVARHNILRRLASELSETCNITALNGSQALYIDRVECMSPLRAQLHPGSRVPLYCTASGKLFLAYMSKQRRERLLEKLNIERFTERTHADRHTLQEELQRIRRRGYAVDNEEYVAGLRCVAVPVLDSSRKTIAAVAVQAPAVRLPFERTGLTLPALRRAAAEIAATYEVVERDQKCRRASQRS
ncbi:MAG: IclR family transcriptional regulator [Burkholderiaceae bacterium]|nr:IclR family transcriptional regulator [Burkholderiaceae bacterium]